MVKPLVKVPFLSSSTLSQQNNQSFEKIIEDFLTFLWRKEVGRNTLVNQDPYMTKLERCIVFRKNVKHYASIYRINLRGEKKLSTCFRIILQHFRNLALLSVGGRVQFIGIGRIEDPRYPIITNAGGNIEVSSWFSDKRQLHNFIRSKKFGKHCEILRSKEPPLYTYYSGFYVEQIQQDYIWLPPYLAIKTLQFLDKDNCFNPIYLEAIEQSLEWKWKMYRTPREICPSVLSR